MPLGLLLRVIHAEKPDWEDKAGDLKMKTIIVETLK